MKIVGRDKSGGGWFIEPHFVGSNNNGGPFREEDPNPFGDGELGDFREEDPDLYGDDEGGMNNFQNNEPSGTPYQITIPDWLKRMAERGYSREWERAHYALGGEPLSTQAAVAQRRLGGLQYRTGVSKSGFIARRMREIQFEKQKALAKLNQAIAEQDEEAKLRAIDTLNSIKQENERLKEQWDLMTAQERLAAQQRATMWEQFLEQRRIQQKAEEREWWQSLISSGAKILPFLL